MNIRIQDILQMYCQLKGQGFDMAGKNNHPLASSLRNILVELVKDPKMLMILLLQLVCAFTLVAIGITSGRIAVAIIGVAFAILAALDKWLSYRKISVEEKR